MSIQRFKSLLLKVTRIQSEIDREQRRALPDWVRLLKLKKLRLKIKDALMALPLRDQRKFAIAGKEPILLGRSRKRKH
jgi:hypothetical protein